MTKSDTSEARIAYRLSEFAMATGIPYPTVYSQVRAGKIPSVLLGSIRVIPASYLKDRLKSLNATD